MHRTQYFLSCVKTYPGKEKNKRKKTKEQIRSDKMCIENKTYRKLVKISY